MPPLNNQQLNDFLNSGGAHLMKLATLTPEGYPYVTPVWYDYDGEAFYVAGRRTANWVETHPRRRARVRSASTPATPRTPASSSRARQRLPIPHGSATGSTGQSATRAKKQARSYYEETKHMPRAYIRITPRKITTWAGPGSLPGIAPSTGTPAPMQGMGMSLVLINSAPQATICDIIHRKHLVSYMLHAGISAFRQTDEPEVDGGCYQASGGSASPAHGSDRRSLLCSRPAGDIAPSLDAHKRAHGAVSRAWRHLRLPAETQR